MGKTLTRIVYHLVKKSQPDLEFTDKEYLQVTARADCDNISHSPFFVCTMLHHLASAVRGCLARIFGTRMVSTGHLPLVNLSADKATHQRWSRQFVGGITVNPGA